MLTVLVIIRDKAVLCVGEEKVLVFTELKMVLLHSFDEVATNNKSLCLW
jgi:hypothetical protein